MSKEMIYISSLGHNDIKNEFQKVITERKYACFYSWDLSEYLNLNMGNGGRDSYLLAMPFNREIHWFLLRELVKHTDRIDLEVIDKCVLSGNPVTTNITLFLNEKGSLDNLNYNFSGDVDRYNSDLKIIEDIRRNSMGDYTFSFLYENVFTLTPGKD